MTAVTLTLANRSYALRRGTSVRRLEKRLIAAVRRGAGFVRLPLAAGPEVHALISPSTPVTIEFTPTPEPRMGGQPGECGAPPVSQSPSLEAAAQTGPGVVPDWMAEGSMDWLDLERGLTPAP